MRLDPITHSSASDVVFEQLATSIVGGDVEPGESLPSERALDLWDAVVDASGNVVYRLLFNALRRAYEPVMDVLAVVSVTRCPTWTATPRSSPPSEHPILDGQLGHRGGRRRRLTGRHRYPAVAHAPGEGRTGELVDS